MDTPINPLVDYAFKLLLGNPSQTEILVDFLNAVLKTQPPIEQVTILNPFNPQEFDQDKLTIVDVKAIDQDGKTYQIEVQLDLRKTLQSRALFSWARIYGAQLDKGDDYLRLKPVHSIWILDGVLFHDSTRVHHRFRMVDDRYGLLFSDHIEVHMLQLGRFDAKAPLDDEGRWVYFLTEARNWTELPADLNSPTLRMAMDQLKTISESARDLERYRAREDFQRQQLTIENERKQLDRELAEIREALTEVKRVRDQAEKDRAQAEKDRDLAEKDRTKAEKDRDLAEQQRDRLREQLRSAGLDPDS